MEQNTTKRIAKNTLMLYFRQILIMIVSLYTVRVVLNTLGAEDYGIQENRTLKRVITYGTFDLLHYGHINLLKRAKALGDYLIVALSTDEFNWNEKQKKCYFSYEKRKALLEAIRYVDQIGRAHV